MAAMKEKFKIIAKTSSLSVSALANPGPKNRAINQEPMKAWL